MEECRKELRQEPDQELISGANQDFLHRGTFRPVALDLLSKVSLKVMVSADRKKTSDDFEHFHLMTGRDSASRQFGANVLLGQSDLEINVTV